MKIRKNLYPTSLFAIYLGVLGYENFGWEADESLSENRESRNPALQQRKVLRPKRNRKIFPQNIRLFPATMHCIKVTLERVKGNG